MPGIVKMIVTMKLFVGFRLDHRHSDALTAYLNATSRFHDYSLGSLSCSLFGECW
jgi:hypothetical protein